MRTMGASGRHRRGRGRAMTGLAWLLFALAGTRAFAASSPVAGALDGVAGEATRKLGSLPGRSVVVAAPLVSDENAPKSAELALQVAVLVAGKIGGGARANPQTAALETARAVAGRASALVYVQSTINAGDLRVTVDVYPPMPLARDRIRNPLPSPMSHAFASAKIDAEVRTFLRPLMLEQASVVRARHDEGDILAAACGDVDGDGGNELVLVSRDHVTLGRVRAGVFVPERTAPFALWGPRVPVPMREPLGGAAISEGRVRVGSTDRGGFSLADDFATATPLAGVPVKTGEAVACLTAEPSAGAFDGAPIDCTANRDPKPIMAVPAPRFDAFAAAKVAALDRTTTDLVAVREPNGRLRLRVGDVVTVPDGVVGAQIVLADLDEDGTPEIVTTAAGTDDAINVLDVSPKAETRPRLHLSVPEPVRALSVCPPETDGAPALIAVVGGELWIVRAKLAPAGRDGAARPASPDRER